MVHWTTQITENMNKHKFIMEFLLICKKVEKILSCFVDFITIEKIVGPRWGVSYSFVSMTWIYFTVFVYFGVWSSWPAKKYHNGFGFIVWFDRIISYLYNTKVRFVKISSGENQMTPFTVCLGLWQSSMIACQQRQLAKHSGQICYHNRLS